MVDTLPAGFDADAVRARLVDLVMEALDNPRHTFWTTITRPELRPIYAPLVGWLHATLPGAPPNVLTLAPDVRAEYLAALQRRAQEPR